MTDAELALLPELAPPGAGKANHDWHQLILQGFFVWAAQVVESAIMPKRMNDVDDHVGRHVRARRREIGMSRVKLAGAIGISYQQVGKYETGIDRVAAGRLWTIAEALKVDVGYFFDNTGSPVEPTPEPAGGSAQQERATLVSAFTQISSSGTRSAILRLVREAAREARAEARRPKD